MTPAYFLRHRLFRILFLLLICYFSFFMNNRLIYADIMESRNLVTAREIVAEGNWLIPTMNGELRLEKPPLPTWIAAVVEIVSPDNLPLQRAAAGLVATLLVFFVYLFASRQTGNRLLGMIGAVTLCTSFNIILMGRTATWDIYCHGFMLGAIYFLFKGGQKEGKNWKEFLWAGFFMGFYFLGKGPVSFYALLLPFLIAWGLVYRPSLRGKIGPLAVMVILCLVISLWWPVLLYFTHKEILLSVWDKEATAWFERSVRPWYYYWKFFVETGVWALFLLTALIWPYWKKKVYFRKEYLFAVCWVFMVLICLSVLPEKKTRYLLPILIPSALVIAHLFMYWWQVCQRGRLMGTEKILLRTNAFLIAAIVCLLPVGIYIVFYRSVKPDLTCFIFLTLLLEAIGIWLFRSALRDKPLSYIGGVLCLFMGVEIWGLPVVVSLFNNPGLKSIHAVREIGKLKELPFYYDCREELRIEIVYEAGRKILPYCFQEEKRLPALPFVLVSQESAEKVLPADLQQHLRWEVIGLYDDNKRPADTPWHSPKFVHYVTLVSAAVPSRNSEVTP